MQLDESSHLAAWLLQISGPAHIPWNDPRWQEVLHGYDVWVHLEYEPSSDDVNHSTTNNIVAFACTNMTKHAATSSNLAALAIHVTRMLNGLFSFESVTKNNLHSFNNNHADGASHARAPPVALPDFTQRIALIGKARATAGALKLLRIFLHHVIVSDAAAIANTGANGGSDRLLPEVLTYRCRDHSSKSGGDKQAGIELVNALLDFLSQYHIHTRSKTLLSIPELYDTTVLNLELLLVLLSTQLYQPMFSSQQRYEATEGRRRQQPHKNGTFNGSLHESVEDHNNYFLDEIMALGRQSQDSQHPSSLMHRHQRDGSITDQHDWTVQILLTVMLNWMIHRPAAPDRSIVYHHAELARSVVQAKGEKMGPDGMYESHVIVTACKSSLAAAQHQDLDKQGVQLTVSKKTSTSMILDATKGVLVLSSSIILLPFRLMSLALGLWGHRHRKGYDQARRLHLRSSLQSPHRRTRDVMWLSESPVADLSSSLFLLLVNNHRHVPSNGGNSGKHDDYHNAWTNPFRAELATLSDYRWEGVPINSMAASDTFALPDLPDLLAPIQQNSSDDDEDPNHVNYDEEDVGISAPLLMANPKQDEPPHGTSFVANFESIFESFGGTLYTEVGALLLYTLLQSSPSFAESIAVRSDLDTLVLPLLRTLYFATAPRHYTTMDFAGRTSSSHTKDSLLSIQNCPFRSQSQLYVLLILLLLFSQDASFGPDAFRRVVVSSVPWYKERHLKDINLGSVLLLTLLRSLTFNLNRLHDSFLLSNCCAVLMNLSPNVVELHDYAAMRLASVTMTCWKRYATLRREAEAVGAGDIKGRMTTAGSSDDIDDSEDDLTTPLGMHREVARTLLRLVKHCLSPRNIERNLHLVYALVYHQNDFHKIVSKAGTDNNCVGRMVSPANFAVVISDFPCLV